MRRTSTLAAVVGVWLVAFTTGFSASDPWHPGTGLVPTLDALARETFPADGPGAVVIAARGGRALFRRAYGLADLEFGTLLEPDMPLRVGSVTKQFTAALVMRLVEQKQLQLQDTIGARLPDYPEPGRAITIEQLLAHTSGLPNYTALPDYREEMTRRVSVPQLLARFSNRPLEFPPGSRFSYSNSGYAVLGAIVERVTGKRFAEALGREVLTRAGLKETRIDDDERITPRRVHGYEWGDSVYRNAPYLDMSVAYAGGALITTVDDLLAWDTALSNGGVLTASSLERMFAPYRLSDGSWTHYGLGWSLSEYDGHRIAEHGGGLNGFRCHVIRAATDGIYVAVLSNNGSSGRAVERLARKVASLLLGAPLAEPTAMTLPPSVLDLYVGSYRFSDGPPVRITRDGAELHLDRGDTDSAAWYPVTIDQFVERGSVARVAFHRDHDGRVTGFRVTGWGEPADATRQP
jgi:CubicO group peptidase (beta-lactamase class C family)